MLLSRVCLFYFDVYISNFLFQICIWFKISFASMCLCAFGLYSFILFILPWTFFLSVLFMFQCAKIFEILLCWCIQNKCQFITISCYWCVKHLHVTITVRWYFYGLYFQRTSSKVLTSIFDLQCQMSNSFGAFSHSQSIDFTRKLHTGTLLHTMFQRCFTHRLSQGVLRGM